MTKDSETGLGKIDLTDALGTNLTVDASAPVFIVKTEGDGSVTGDIVYAAVDADGKGITTTEAIETQATVFVDYYVIRKGSNISEIQIDASNFAGYYYVEASTLFRRQEDGVDMPAEITFPNVKIQSNFTFTMASTGDPSTFTFTMDAFPGYTYFDQTKKVLCVIQVIEDAEGTEEAVHTVMGHDEEESIENAYDDSTAAPGGLVVRLVTAPALTSDNLTVAEGGTATVTIGTAPTFNPEGLATYTLSGDTTVETVVSSDANVTKTAVVTYAVNPTALAAYNAENGTNYSAADVTVPSPTNLTWKIGTVTSG